MNKTSSVSPRALVIFTAACLVAIGIGLYQWSVQSEQRHRIALAAHYKVQLEEDRRRAEALSKEAQTAVAVWELAEQYIKLAARQKNAQRLPGLTVDQLRGRETPATVDIPVKPDYTKEMDKILLQILDLRPEIILTSRALAPSDLSGRVAAVTRIREEEKAAGSQLNKELVELKLAEIELIKMQTLGAP